MKIHKPDPSLPLLSIDQACEELSVLEKRTIGQFEFCYLVTRRWSGKIIQVGKVEAFWTSNGVRYQIHETAPVKEDIMPSQAAPPASEEREPVQGIIFDPEEDELPGQYRQPPNAKSPGRQPRKAKAATRPR